MPHFSSSLPRGLIDKGNDTLRGVQKWLTEVEHTLNRLALGNTRCSAMCAMSVVEVQCMDLVVGTVVIASLVCLSIMLITFADTLFQTPC